MTRLFGLVGFLFGGLVVAPLLVLGAAASGSAGTVSGSPLIAELESAGFENGRLPDEALVVVSSRPGYDCRVAAVGGAADAWRLLSALARLDGVAVEGGWCYRTYAEQLELWTRRQCWVAGSCDGDPFPPTAEPGTSVHGWGLAVDVWGGSGTVLGCSSPELGWLQVNAPRFGWVHPSWAGCGRAGAEPWHWEFVGPSGPAAGTGGS